MHLVTWQLSATCCWASRGFQGNRSLSCRWSSTSEGEPRFGPEGLTPAGHRTGAKVSGGTPKPESTGVECGDAAGGAARAEPCGACSAPRAGSCFGSAPPARPARPAHPAQPIRANRTANSTAAPEQRCSVGALQEELRDTSETPFLRCVSKVSNNHRGLGGSFPPLHARIQPTCILCRLAQSSHVDQSPLPPQIPFPAHAAGALPTRGVAASAHSSSSHLPPQSLPVEVLPAGIRL